MHEKPSKEDFAEYKKYLEKVASGDVDETAEILAHESVVKELNEAESNGYKIAGSNKPEVLTPLDTTEPTNEEVMKEGVEGMKILISRMNQALVDLRKAEKTIRYFFQDEHYKKFANIRTVTLSDLKQSDEELPAGMYEAISIAEKYNFDMAFLVEDMLNEIGKRIKATEEILKECKDLNK